MRRAGTALRRQRLSSSPLALIMPGKRPTRISCCSEVEQGRIIRTRNAVAEAENIVVATAEKIFADLADPQTINHDKNGGWRLPLWQALSEAGLPLAWVAEELGGAGADLADGFAVVNAAG